MEELTVDDYPVRRPLMTRWNDNDQNGHLNNAVYIELFDTLLNSWIAEFAAADDADASALPVVAETHCRYLSELAFPESVQGLLSVERVGTSSVTYQLALADARGAIAARCRWVQVYIDPLSRRPVPIPRAIRVGAEAIRGQIG